MTGDLQRVLYRKFTKILLIPEGEAIPAEWQDADPRHELIKAEEDAWEAHVEASLESWVDEAIAQMSGTQHHVQGDRNPPNKDTIGNRHSARGCCCAWAGEYNFAAIRHQNFLPAVAA
jgi:hypothetical protein